MTKPRKYCQSNKTEQLKMEQSLINACKSGKVQTLKKMLSLGVPPDTRMENIRKQTVAMLIPYVFLHKRKSLQCRHNFYDQETILSLLVDYGANLMLTDAFGMSVLHHFAGGCDLDTLVILLENIGGDINYRNENGGNTALHYICCSQTKSVSIMRTLLKYGADPNIQNSNGNTPLHLCANRRLTKLIQLLIEYSADVNIQNNFGETPLHYTCFYFCLDVKETHSIIHPKDESRYIEENDSMTKETIILLLQNGAKLDIPNIYGRTIMHTYIASLSHSYVRFACGIKESDKQMNVFCKCNNHQMLEVFLEIYKHNYNNGTFNMPPSSRSHETPLHCLYESGCINETHDFFFFLRGANPNIKDLQGFTPFERMRQRMFTWRRSNIQNKFFMRTLILNIQAGFDLHNLSKQGRRYFASDVIYCRDADIVKIIISSGYTFVTENRAQFRQSHGVENFWHEAFTIEMTPRPLQRLTANVIRILAKPNAIVGLRDIGLPKNLLSYITFNFKEDELSMCD